MSPQTHPLLAPNATTTDAMTDSFSETLVALPPERYLVWVDGAGAFLLCVGDCVSIGGPSWGRPGADLSLLASLSRCHASIVRSGDRYVIEPHAPTLLQGKPLVEREPLPVDCELCLGTNVLLRFQMPSVLSPTACLDFLSHHRPAQAVDRVILMHETCLMGPGPDAHIPCPDWPTTVVLFRRENAFWVRGATNLVVDGELVQERARVEAGSLVTGPEIRFRLEAL